MFLESLGHSGEMNLLQDSKAEKVFELSLTDSQSTVSGRTCNVSLLLMGKLDHFMNRQIENIVKDDYFC